MSCRWLRRLWEHAEKLTDLGAVEDRGLVHVVPGVEVLGAAGVVGGQEARRPVVPHLAAQRGSERERAIEIEQESERVR
eukprot:1788983-Rhodomonas_salina.2